MKLMSSSMAKLFLYIHFLFWLWYEYHLLWMEPSSIWGKEPAMSRLTEQVLSHSKQHLTLLKCPWARLSARAEAEPAWPAAPTVQFTASHLVVNIIVVRAERPRRNTATVKGSSSAFSHALLPLCLSLTPEPPLPSLPFKEGNTTTHSLPINSTILDNRAFHN